MIDGQSHNLEKDHIICLTEFHKVSFEGVCEINMLRFNRSFYCILDHDDEVGCKGLLFFGAAQLPAFKIPNEELEKFETLWRMFELELESKDNMQLEMLQSMLKRLIILSTRVYKQQEQLLESDGNQLDLVREFNFLVEQHFREKHTVASYAKLLNKSPKTLANTFKRIIQKSPLQFIKERRMIEARRQLRYSKQSIKEIAYDLGFEDIQSFSRFFKNEEQISPSDYRTSA